MMTAEPRRHVRQRAATAVLVVAVGCLVRDPLTANGQPFGKEYPNLDSLATGQWWTKKPKKAANAPPPMDVPRDQVVAFALYTCDRGVLKLTAQLYPLRPGED